MLMALAPKSGILDVTVNLQKMRIRLVEFCLFFFFVLFKLFDYLTLLFLSIAPVSPQLDSLFFFPHFFLILHSFLLFINAFIIVASVTNSMQLSIQPVSPAQITFTGSFLIIDYTLTGAQLA